MTLTGRRRFEALLNGLSKAVYDVPVLDRGEWLVAPTLGAIVPGWLLIIPRRHTLSFRDWAAVGGQSTLDVLADLRSHLGLTADEIIWFEHGPGSLGTLVGCGLDHAHLHVLLRPPFSFEQFADQACAAVDLNWVCSTATEGYRRLESATSYLVAGSGERAVTAVGVEAAGSQFFRRVVAGLAGEHLEWDYRTSAHMPNVDETIATFKRLENAARRGA